MKNAPKQGFKSGAELKYLKDENAKLLAEIEKMKLQQDYMNIAPNNIINTENIERDQEHVSEC
jgi:hypothetical protein